MLLYEHSRLYIEAAKNFLRVCAQAVRRWVQFGRPAAARVAAVYVVCTDRCIQHATIFIYSKRSYYLEWSACVCVHLQLWLHSVDGDLLSIMLFQTQTLHAVCMEQNDDPEFRLNSKQLLNKRYSHSSTSITKMLCRVRIDGGGGGNPQFLCSFHCDTLTPDFLLCCGTP